MRTTIELPDDLLAQAKSSAALSGITLRQFFMEAVRSRLAPERRKVRKAPPAIGDSHAPGMKVLTREQIDEAMFG
jgi:Arc/MetJ family transcription regulator